MKRRKIIPYNPKLKEYARELRNNSTYTELSSGITLKENNSEATTSIGKNR